MYFPCSEEHLKLPSNSTLVALVLKAHATIAWDESRGALPVRTSTGLVTRISLA